MVVRARGINWDYLVNPTMRGIDTESQANAGFAHSILAGLTQVGEGITTRRKEREHRREFDVEQARLREATIDLKREAMLDRQARQTNLLDSTQAAAEAALGGDEDAVQALPDLADALGGPQVALDRIANRSDSIMFPDANIPIRTGAPEDPALAADHAAFDLQHPVMPRPMIPGEMGLVDGPADFLAGKAAEAKADLDGLKAAQRQYMMTHGKHSLATSDQKDQATVALRAKEELTFKRFKGRIAEASAAYGGLNLRAAQAKMRETKAQALEDAKARMQVEIEAKAAATDRERAEKHIEARQMRDAIPNEWVRANPEFFADDNEQAWRAAYGAFTDEQKKARETTKYGATTGANAAANRAAQNQRSTAGIAARVSEGALNRGARAASEGRKEATREENADYKKAVAPLERELSEARKAYESADSALLKGDLMADTDFLKSEIEKRKVALDAAERKRDEFNATWDAGHKAGKESAAPASAAPPAGGDFDAVDAAVRKEMAGKPERDIRAEVLRRLRGG